MFVQHLKYQLTSYIVVVLLEILKKSALLEILLKTGHSGSSMVNRMSCIALDFVIG